MPSSRLKISVTVGMTRSISESLSFTTTLQSLDITLPPCGIRVPLADTILIGFCHFLHGILFFSTKARSKTEHEAPVSAIMIRGTDFSIPEDSLKTTCDWKIKRFLALSSLQTMVGSFVRRGCCCGS